MKRDLAMSVACFSVYFLIPHQNSFSPMLLGLGAVFLVPFVVWLYSSVNNYFDRKEGGAD
jgi:Ca2+/Na+ antiporter